MYTDTFDAPKVKQRALAVLRKQNAAATQESASPLRRLLPQLFARKPLTPFQESLAVHMYCAAPHSALE